jgi:hypothetical protein
MLHKPVIGVLLVFGSPIFFIRNSKTRALSYSYRLKESVKIITNRKNYIQPGGLRKNLIEALIIQRDIKRTDFTSIQEAVCVHVCQLTNYR